MRRACRTGSASARHRGSAAAATIGRAVRARRPDQGPRRRRGHDGGHDGPRREARRRRDRRPAPGAGHRRGPRRARWPPSRPRWRRSLRSRRWPTGRPRARTRDRRRAQPGRRPCARPAGHPNGRRPARRAADDRARPAVPHHRVPGVRRAPSRPACVGRHAARGRERALADRLPRRRGAARPVPRRHVGRCVRHRLARRRCRRRVGRRRAHRALRHPLRTVDPRIAGRELRPHRGARPRRCVGEGHHHHVDRPVVARRAPAGPSGRATADPRDGGRCRPPAGALRGATRGGVRPRGRGP